MPCAPRLRSESPCADIASPVLLVACSAIVLAACGGSGEKDSLQTSSSSAACAAPPTRRARQSRPRRRRPSPAPPSGATSERRHTGAEHRHDRPASALPADLQPGELGDNEVANVAGSGVTKDEFDHLLEIARAQQTSQGGEAPKAGTPRTTRSAAR